MNIKNKIKFYIILLLIIPLVLLFPVNYIYSQEESSDSEIFDTGRLIPFSDCPFDFIINVGDNFTKVEIQHYGQDGSVDKFGGWKAWLEVNGDLVYEWLSWDSEIGAEWYDYTEQSYYYDNESRPDYTDITDYIHPGENIITFYHYTEGPGSGIIVKVYYGAKQEEESYDYEETQEEAFDEEVAQEDSGYYEAEEGVQDEYQTEEFDLGEILEQEETAQQDDTQAFTDTEVDEQELIFNFKSRYINPDNPQYVYVRGIPGITEEKLREYKNKYMGLYSRLLGPGEYVPAATSWEDVARLAVLESKVHYNNARNLGYFQTLYNVLSIFYVAQSFRESLADIPGQLKTLKSIDSAKELIKHKDTIFLFSSNMIGIYDGARSIKKEGADEKGFPEIDSKVMFVIGAVSSGGWSMLGDMSKGMFIENAKYTVNYEIEKATLNSSLAYHAQKIHEIAINHENISAREINEFFFHARRIVSLKKLDVYLDIGDSVSIWQENQDLATKLSNLFGVIDASAALDAELYGFDITLSNYEEIERYLESDMDDLGVEWQLKI